MHSDQQARNNTKFFHMNAWSCKQAPQLFKKKFDSVACENLNVIYLLVFKGRNSGSLADCSSSLDATGGAFFMD